MSAAAAGVSRREFQPALRRAMTAVGDQAGARGVFALHSFITSMGLLFGKGNTHVATQ